MTIKPAAAIIRLKTAGAARNRTCYYIIYHYIPFDRKSIDMEENEMAKEPKMVTCKHCGAEIAASAKACPKCGTDKTLDKRGKI